MPGRCSNDISCSFGRALAQCARCLAEVHTTGGCEAVHPPGGGLGTGRSADMPSASFGRDRRGNVLSRRNSRLNLTRREGFTVETEQPITYVATQAKEAHQWEGTVEYSPLLLCGRGAGGEGAHERRYIDAKY